MPPTFTSSPSFGALLLTVRFGAFRFASSAPGASTSQGPSAGNSHQPAHSSSSHLSKQAAASQQQDATDQWQTVKGASGKAKGSKRAESGSAPAGGPVARAVPAYASASPLDFQEPWRDDALAPGNRYVCSQYLWVW